ncbi:MAG: helix-turn-helix domain-containing protein, partial [Erysipelotrichaceae bacterium]|nr:helix-turn-helix domain-containing protein [Erysipelotrichaceae bacterium]
MMNEYDTIGKRIAKARKDAGMTQSDVAEKLHVTFQAVSSWERDEFVPETFNLIELARVLEVSVSSLTEKRGDYVFETQKEIFEWEHMASFVRHTARAFKMRDTLKALDFALKAHEGQTRKQSDVPYIYHPLNMACHCFAMNIHEDVIVAACLLHDVIEDCGYNEEDLP